MNLLGYEFTRMDGLDYHAFADAPADGMIYYFPSGDAVLIWSTIDQTLYEIGTEDAKEYHWKIVGIAGNATTKVRGEPFDVTMGIIFDVLGLENTG